MTNTVGRHRAPGRYNPAAELGQIVAAVSTPLAKGSAVVAASGGLVAAIAIPAQASTLADAPAAPAAKSATVELPAAAATPAVAVTAPVAEAASEKVSADFGRVAVEPVAKPTGPTPEELRERAERQAAEERAAEERAAEEAAQEQAAERQETVASRSQERTAPAQTAPEPAPAAAPSTSNVIEIAKRYIGTPYVYGGSTPAGFDCSGFTQYVFAQAGVSIPRVTTAQQAAATPVSNPQPGDLVFFGSPSWHVGIYVGNGMMIDSPRTGSSVSIRPVFSGVSGYGRI